MKKIICLIALLFTIKASAQDSRLFENDWYLNNIIIDGNNNPAPSNSDLNFIILALTDTQTKNFLTYACEVFSAIVVYDQINPRFSFSQYGTVFIGDCSFQPNIDYATLYFSFFENEISFPFTYEVTTTNGIRFLSITNESGDQAFYADQLLSIDDLDAPKLGASPNPFIDKITISSAQGDITEIHMYNLLGKEVFQQKGNSQEVFLEELSSGVYFLKVYTDRGIATKKLIKMN